MTHGTLAAYEKGCRCDPCRACKASYNAAHHAANRPARLKQMSEYGAARRKDRRAWIDSIKLERGCADCGYRHHPAALDFDHVGSDKTFSVGHAGSRSEERVLEEIAKCEVVCANCHRIRTVERRLADQDGGRR